MVNLLVQEGNMELAAISDKIESQELVVNKEYQRDFVYDRAKCSRLIESFLLNIPVPEIFLCECPNGKDEVIDGQQRVTSIHNFLTNEFALVGLTTLVDLNGLKFRDLGQAIQRMLRKKTLEYIRIPMENAHMKYEIFARLNQGSTTLTQQEIRNCIYHGSCNDMLVRLAADPIVERLFHDRNRRFCYQDRILTFFALQNYQEISSHRAPCQNLFMQEHQNDSEAQIAKLEKLFLNTMSACEVVLGEDAFFMPDIRKSPPFNKSIFESIAIGFSQFPKAAILKHKAEIAAEINRMKATDMDYISQVSAKNSSKGHIQRRVQTIVDVITKYLGKK